MVQAWPETTAGRGDAPAVREPGKVSARASSTWNTLRHGQVNSRVDMDHPLLRNTLSQRFRG